MIYKADPVSQWFSKSCALWEAQRFLNPQLPAAGLSAAAACPGLHLMVHTKPASETLPSSAQVEQGLQLVCSFITPVQSRNTSWCYQAGAELELQPTGNPSSLEHLQLEHPCFPSPELTPPYL